MYKDGYTNLVNIDISDEVIKRMKEYHEKQGVNCEWIEMDATKLEFPDESFDLVIDKGTLDAVLCGDNYDIPNKILKEMFRVAKKDRSVLIISHGIPSRRKFLFEWNLYPETATVKYRPQQLSPEVNLINILRSTGKGMSLSQITKDPELFSKCMVEWKEEINKPDAGQKGYTSLPFEHHEIEVTTVKLQEEGGQNLALNMIEGNEEVKEGKDDKTLNNSEDNSTPQEGEPKDEAANQGPKKKSMVRVEDSGYNPPRQDHCFIYIVTKTA